ncbi:nitroreductase [Mogibacterium diversum]|uniref:Nitroreductase n=1 Tax=Mogibacterium diversum TaxID=114527 RepID=A0A2S0L4M5_9FIRM|nr:nitroreductase [Mogibacterium diversum]MBF1319315.1 nitroreductase family protein [Mogibacterium diversum]MBF1358879.1 nitroreductase family protein [Mogibacterium diversum]
MVIKDLIKKNRSVRGYDNSRDVTIEELREMVDCARLSASSVNMQPLKYILVNTVDGKARVLKQVSFAAKLSTLKLPHRGSEPMAYIVICQDEQISKSETGFLRDVGIVAQSITLAATELGLGACMLGYFSPDKLRQALDLSENLKPLLVISLGKSVEDIRIVEIEEGESTDYYRDEAGIHYVPKRKLDDVIITR